WLEDRGVGDAWRIAPALVDTGWTLEMLTSAVGGLEADLGTHLTRWIGLQSLADQMLGEVEIAARRISELVRIVKDYSYLDQAPVQEIDPTAGIEDTLVLLKHKLGEIEVVLDFEDDLAPVEAPGRDLNQVWTNLVDNAADAMVDGGTLTVTARNSADSVVIEISDTGIGMPPDVADRIFDPFFTTKEPGKGTGLGLHTVHTIITRIGGTISVASSQAGTTFTVELPTTSGTSDG
ncbi:MAG TPA: HAMP domain-containing histidine kinase, partial [Acidimicrobiia bacterium]|nr:HAMP domain-containing histidine kinase [Acidimicrobiia bacterium]